MKAIFPLAVLLLLLTVMGAGAASLTITELAVTTKVSRGKPIDSVHRISYQAVHDLYGFTRTQSDLPEETTVTHLWFRDGQQIKETKLPIKGRRWRVYSTLPVNATSVGSWRFEVRDAAGTLLKSAEFQIH